MCDVYTKQKNILFLIYPNKFFYYYYYFFLKKIFPNTVIFIKTLKNVFLFFINLKIIFKNNFQKA